MKYISLGPLFKKTEMPPFCCFDERDGDYGIYPLLSAPEQAENAGDVVMLQAALLHYDEVPEQLLKPGVKVMIYDSIHALAYYEDGVLIWEDR